LKQDRILQWVRVVVLKTIKERRLNHLDPSILISAGHLGYAQSQKRFDPNRGVKFKTFAEYRIKGAVLDEVRRQIGDERTQIQRPAQVDLDLSLIEDECKNQERLDAAIDIRTWAQKELSERESEVFEMRLEGMSGNEIAKVLNIDREVVIQTLAQIRRRIYPWFQARMGAEFKIIEKECRCGHINHVSNSKIFECEKCGLAGGSFED
jgi:RNA polymerase sigma factor (sigma-70 family)